MYGKNEQIKENIVKVKPPRQISPHPKIPFI